MKPIVCAVALFYFLDVLRAAAYTQHPITVGDLIRKLQNDMKEGGNTCTDGFEDTLRIGGSTWTVKCSKFAEKYIEADVAFAEDGFYSAYTVRLTTSGKLIFFRPNGVVPDVDPRFSNEETVLYLKEKHDPPIQILPPNPGGIVEITITELRDKLQAADLQGKGNSCHKGSEDTLYIDGSSWTVKCSEGLDKYITTEASWTRGGPFVKNIIYLTWNGGIAFVRPPYKIVSESVPRELYDVTTIYLKENHDPPIRKQSSSSGGQLSGSSTSSALSGVIKITLANLRNKLLNELRDKGEFCTRDTVDYLHIDGSSWKVECSDSWQKYFIAEGSWDKEGPFSKLAIYWTTYGLVFKVLPQGLVSEIIPRYLYDVTTIYLKENHDVPLQLQPASAAEQSPAGIRKVPSSSSPTAPGTVAISLSELQTKLQDTLKEKGNKCTTGTEDILHIGDSTWTVKCNRFLHKFFQALAALREEGPYSKLTIMLLSDGRVTLTGADGKIPDVDPRSSDKEAMIYLKENHDLPVNGKPVAIAVTALKQKMREELKEKGDKCSPWFEDVLKINESTWTVKCTFFEQKYFEGDVALSEGGPYKKYRIVLGMDGKITLMQPGSLIAELDPYEFATIYLKENHELPVQHKFVSITVAALKEKMREELKEKGDTCSPWLEDILKINGSTWTVKCTFFKQKYFEGDVALAEGGPYKKYRIVLTMDGKISFMTPGSLIPQFDPYEFATIFLRENNAPPVKPPTPATSASKFVMISIGDLRRRIQDDLKEKGNMCTSSDSEDILRIDGSAWTVGCTGYKEKFLKAEVALGIDSPYEKFAIYMTAKGTLIFRITNTVIPEVDERFADESKIIYLQEKHDVRTKGFVPIKISELKGKLMNDLKEKGNSCTTFSLDTLRIGRSSWTVRCTRTWEKYFKAEVGLERDGRFEPFTIQLSLFKELFFIKPDGQKDQRFSDEDVTVYLKENHDPEVPSTEIKGFVPIKISELKDKLIREFKEKDTSSTLSSIGTLHIGGSTWTVKSTPIKEKYFNAEAGFARDGHYEPYKITLTLENKITFTGQDGHIDHRYSNEDMTVYLKENKDLLEATQVDENTGKSSTAAEPSTTTGQPSTNIKVSSQSSAPTRSGKVVEPTHSELVEAYTKSETYFSTANALKVKPETVVWKLKKIPVPRDCINQQLQPPLRREYMVFNVFCSDIGERYFKAMIALEEGQAMFECEITLKASGVLVYRGKDGVFRHLLYRPFIYLMEVH